MKKALLTIIEPTTATLLIALAIGLAIAVHPVFFGGFAHRDFGAGGKHCQRC